MSNESPKNEQLAENGSTESSTTTTQDGTLAGVLSSVDYAGVMRRLRDVTFQPRQIWTKLEEEQAAARDIMRRYYLPLAVFAAFCAYIGNVIAFNAVFRPILGALGILALLAGWPFLVAFIMSKMARSFQGELDFEHAFRLAAYSSLPGLAGWVLRLLPSLLTPVLLLAVAGYSVYVLYFGLEQTANIPAERRVGFLVTSVLLSLIGFAVALWVLSKILPFVV